MMQDGNKSRSKCGVMLALGGCCASDRLCAALRCAGDESSVGRSVDSLFWRAGVIRLFPPSPFPLTRPAQHPREKQVCLCQLAAPWPAHVGERVGWRYSYCRLERSGIVTAWAALLSRRTLRYVPRYISYHCTHSTQHVDLDTCAGTWALDRLDFQQSTHLLHCRSLPRYYVGWVPALGFSRLHRSVLACSSIKAGAHFSPG